MFIERAIDIWLWPERNDIMQLCACFVDIISYFQPHNMIDFAPVGNYKNPNYDQVMSKFLALQNEFYADREIFLRFYFHIRDHGQRNPAFRNPNDLKSVINDQSDFSVSEKKKICALSDFEQKILFNYELCRNCGDLYTKKSKCKCGTMDFMRDEISCDLFDLMIFLIGIEKFPDKNPEPQQKRLRFDDSLVNSAAEFLLVLRI